MSSIDRVFFDELKTKFGYYLAFVQHIFHLKDGDEDRIFEEAKCIILEHEIDPRFCIDLIGIAAENNIGNLHAYYNLLQKLKEEFLIDYSYLILKKNSIFFKVIDAEKESPEAVESVLKCYEDGTLQGLILHDNVPEFLTYVKEKNISLNDKEYKITESDNTKYSPIELACYFGAENIFRYLRSENVNFTSRCLEFAFIGKSACIIKELLESGHTPNDACMNNAIMTHLYSYIETMIEEYNIVPDLRKAQDYYNIYLIFRSLSLTPLDQMHFPITLSLSNPELIKILIQRGYDPSLSIISAIRKVINYFPGIKNTKILEIILGPNWNPSDTSVNDWNAFFFSAQGGNPSDIPFLLGRGVDINHIDEFKWNALVPAIRGYNTEYALGLISAGIDFNLPDLDGSTPLMWAAVHDNAEVIKAILAKGVPVDQEDNDKHTALELAADNNSSNAVKILLEAGADPKHKSKYGFTPLQKAQHSHSNRAIAILSQL